MANLREVLTTYAQWQEANLVAVLSDEVGDARSLDAQIAALATRMLRPFARLGLETGRPRRDREYATSVRRL
jgi:hypothetical protein